MIIGQPTYGYPAIKAEIDVINASWDKRGNLKNVADGVGIMVYEGTESLKYVQNYVEGADQWEGITVKIQKMMPASLFGTRNILRYPIELQGMFFWQKNKYFQKMPSLFCISKKPY